MAGTFTTEQVLQMFAQYAMHLHGSMFGGTDPSAPLGSPDNPTNQMVRPAHKGTPNPFDKDWNTNAVWSAPGGDYFNGQSGGEYGNPLADPVPFRDSAVGENADGGPLPAPFGYTQSGRPRQFAGEEDPTSGPPLPGPISRWAPGRDFGPSINQAKQTAANPGNAQGVGRTKAE